MDLLRELAEVAQVKYGRGDLNKLIHVMDIRFLSFTIQDIDPNLVTIEQIIEIEDFLKGFLGFEVRE